jgi:hypothetical protein
MFVGADLNFIPPFCCQSVFTPFKGKEVCICLVEFSFGDGKEDLVVMMI